MKVYEWLRNAYLLSAGRSFRRATCTRHREAQRGVGYGVGESDVPGDVFSALPWDERYAVMSLAVSP